MFQIRRNISRIKKQFTCLFSIKRIKIKNLLENSSSSSCSLLSSSEVIRIKGWVRSIRNSKKWSFIDIYDGSCLSGIQGVIYDDIPQEYQKINKITTGTSIDIYGTIHQSVGNKQSIEIKINQLDIIGDCPAESYPLQKKRHSLEFLRTIGHLRPRTNTFGAVSRISSCLTAATHQFFQNEGFLHVHTPIITSSDCEGAGEMFRVSTSSTDDNEETNDNNNNNNNNSEFFGKPTFLTVSGQLSAEAFTCALGDVYTFGPTFRAENSNTTRHLAEFHMVEPELAFADLEDAMLNAENYVKYIVKYILQHCSEDLNFFTKHYDSTLLTRLNNLCNENFHRISYREAVQILQSEIEKDPSKWKYPDVHFGTDLATEHEKWLAEIYFKGCVFVYNYPKHIKAFYMRDNEDNETVASFDLLVPGMGELIGGSQREERYQVLLNKIEHANLDPHVYSWYLDTRRFGTIPHAGYGLGFERLVCFVTSLENIRDAIPFPRYPGTADY